MVAVLVGLVVVATVPAGAREPALAGACWAGFGQRRCAPRGFVEPLEVAV